MEEVLTIVIPVYNEEECIRPLVVALREFLALIKITCRILFINDGSTDGGGEYIEKICREDARFSYLSLERNAGLSAALKAGIDNCRSRFIGYIDADLQTHPSDFLKLMEFMEDYDLVMGYRADRKDTLVKKVSSFIGNSFRQRLLKDKIIDTGCPLKIIKTEMARQLPFYNGMHRFIPNMILLLGGRVMQVPIRHFPRYAGTPKYSLLNRLTGPFIDALVFKWMQRNSIHYHIAKKS